MRNILILTILYFVINPIAFGQNVKRDEDYKNSFRPDIPRSMQEIPYQDEENLGTHYSPYILVPISKHCKNNKEHLKPGHYLVKVFSENNKDYILFKRRNVAVALMPVSTKIQLPKKVKKGNYELIEDGHGRYIILKINYKNTQYVTKMEVQA